MANATVSRLGQVNASGDANALFLKVFSGEVLATFQRENQMLRPVALSASRITAYCENAVSWSLDA